jgi:hypothetical protein
VENPKRDSNCCTNNKQQQKQHNVVPFCTHFFCCFGSFRELSIFKDQFDWDLRNDGSFRLLQPNLCDIARVRECVSQEKLKKLRQTTQAEKVTKESMGSCSSKSEGGKSGGAVQLKKKDSKPVFQANPDLYKSLDEVQEALQAAGLESSNCKQRIRG